MPTITAVIRVKPGAEAVMRDGLLKVAENVAANEPGTIGFFVCQDAGDPCRFTTYERFVDRAAMDAHNSSEVVAAFFALARPILDGDVLLVTAEEISPGI